MKISALLTLALAPAALGQSTLLVPEQYPTIQAGIDAAVNQDEVSVAPGVYVETLVITGKRVTVSGRQGARATIVDAAQAGRVLSISGAQTNGTLVQGLTLQNGVESSGGGVAVAGASPTLRDLVVQNNRADSDGGGVHLANSDAVLQNVVIRANFTYYWDGGGLWSGGGNPVIAHCTIVDNWIPNDGWGGGVWISTGGARISNSIIWDNVAGWGVWDVGIVSTSLISYSCFSEAGAGGNGNIAQAPAFVEQAAGDYHLLPTSPCVDAGFDAAPGVYAFDFDGNARSVGVDMGADELAPFVYHVGTPTPGGTITIRAVGFQPGDVGTGWLSPGLLASPLSTPYGDWWLADRRVILYQLQSVPASGVYETTWQVPATVPAPLPLFVQAYMAGQLSGVDSLLVR